MYNVGLSYLWCQMYDLIAYKVIVGITLIDINTDVNISKFVLDTVSICMLYLYCNEIECKDKNKQHIKEHKHFFLD